MDDIIRSWEFTDLDHLTADDIDRVLSPENFVLNISSSTSTEVKQSSNNNTPSAASNNYQPEQTTSYSLDNGNIFVIPDSCFIKEEMSSSNQKLDCNQAVDIGQVASHLLTFLELKFPDIFQDFDQDSKNAFIKRLTDRLNNLILLDNSRIRLFNLNQINSLFPILAGASFLENFIYGNFDPTAKTSEYIIEIMSTVLEHVQNLDKTKNCIKFFLIKPLKAQLTIVIQQEKKSILNAQQ